MEDTGIALGQAVAKALGDKKGIRRYASLDLPMDETLTRVAIDISGRPYLVFRTSFSQPKIGEFDTELVREWFQAFAVHAGLTLHVETLYGDNNHHIAESCFKGLARALRARRRDRPAPGGTDSFDQGVIVGLMPRYSVHARSARPDAIRADADRVRFVKEGFSWWGFFFPVPWLLLKGMWETLVFVILVLIAIIAGGAALYVPELAILVLAFGINLIIGFVGYDLYRWTLKRRGLIDVGPASGDNRDEAELRFFLALPSAAPSSQPMTASLAVPQGRDALGLFEAAGAPR